MLFFVFYLPLYMRDRTAPCYLRVVFGNRRLHHPSVDRIHRIVSMQSTLVIHATIYYNTPCFSFYLMIICGVAPHDLGRRQERCRLGQPALRAFWDTGPLSAVHQCSLSIFCSVCKQSHNQHYHLSSPLLILLSLLYSLSLSPIGWS